MGFNKKLSFMRYLGFILLLFIITPLSSQDSLSMERLGNWDPADNPLHGGLQYNDIWGYETDTGEEYALIGGADSIFVVDVTDCANPIKVFSYFGGGGVTWRDLKTFNGYMYSVCDGCAEGMHIFDLNGLPDSPVTHELTTTEFFFKAHNIYIDETNEVLYAVGVQGVQDFTAIDLSSTPEDPTLIDHVDLNDVNGSGNYYIHDIYVKDNIAYCSHGNVGFYVYDFSDLTDIVLLGSIPTGNYNHSSWTDADEGYAYYAEEVPTGLPMGIIDLTNLGSDTEDISIVTTFSDHLESSGASTPHNPFVIGDFLYISYYEDGTKVYDISDRENPDLVAYYDTYPDNVGSYTGYEGNWGTYPFLSSGCIVSSDITYGLNTLQVDWGLTDTCTPVLDLDGTEGSGTYSASNHIYADGTLGSSEVVTYDAEFSVELNVGFSAPAGVDFEAKIEPCQANN